METNNYDIYLLPLFRHWKPEFLVEHPHGKCKLSDSPPLPAALKNKELQSNFISLFGSVTKQSEEHSYEYQFAQEFDLLLKFPWIFYFLKDSNLKIYKDPNGDWEYAHY